MAACHAMGSPKTVAHAPVASTFSMPTNTQDYVYYNVRLGTLPNPRPMSVSPAPEAAYLALVSPNAPNAIVLGAWPPTPSVTPATNAHSPLITTRLLDNVYPVLRDAKSAAILSHVPSVRLIIPISWDSA